MRGSRSWMEMLVVVAILAGIPACQRNHSTGPGASISPAATGAPQFHASIQRLSAEQQRWMTGSSWHSGCPVPFTKLRVLGLDYFNFDGDVVRGRIVANRKIASDLVQVFGMLFAARFPVRHMDVADLYPSDHRPSPIHDDTAAFFCSRIPGTKTWSQHAYGLAVDINPVQNPWVKDGKMLPQRGNSYRDRSQDLPGMVHRGDSVVKAFSSIGWGWGGKWHSLKDYMHFSLSGG